MNLKNQEKYFQEELDLLEILKERFFLDFNKENVAEYMRTWSELRRVIQRYQTLVLQLDSKKTIVAMKEFSKYRHLEETGKIH